TVPVTRRGEFIRLDFGDVDSDGDGMPNSFEQTYFGDATAGDPDDDPDGDGRPNRREAEQGTDPLVADGRHPADIDAADDRLTITEVTRYSLAWQLGEAWSIEPTNIPVAYVTRAAALWTGGEFYTFDNDPPTSAPLWWVNTTPPPSPALATTDGGRSGEGPALASARNVSSRRSVALHAGEPTQNDSTTELLLRRELPLEMSANGEPVRVRITVGPNDDTRAFAIEEQPPAGWTVREISHDGRWDATHRKVKWGPFFDQTVRQLTYLAVPPSNVDATATFSGVGSFDGTDYTI